MTSRGKRPVYRRSVFLLSMLLSVLTGLALYVCARTIAHGQTGSLVTQSLSDADTIDRPANRLRPPLPTVMTGADDGLPPLERHTLAAAGRDGAGLSSADGANGNERDASSDGGDGSATLPDETTAHFGPFDSRLDTEAPDLAWQSTVKKSLEARYDGSNGVTVGDVKCGQTLCRLELNTTIDDGAGRKALKPFSEIAEMQAEVSPRVTQPPLAPQVVVYVARPGKRLPSP